MSRLRDDAMQSSAHEDSYRPRCKLLGCHPVDRLQSRIDTIYAYTQRHNDAYGDHHHCRSNANRATDLHS